MNIACSGETPQIAARQAIAERVSAEQHGQNGWIGGHEAAGEASNTDPSDGFDCSCCSDDPIADRQFLYQNFTLVGRNQGSPRSSKVRMSG